MSEIDGKYMQEHLKHKPVGSWNQDCPVCNPYERKHRELTCSHQWKPVDITNNTYACLHCSEHISGSEIVRTAKLISGPCTICGATNYALSAGGPGICPSCDCGDFGLMKVTRQASEIAALSQQLTEVKAERDGLQKHVMSLIDSLIECAIPYPTKEEKHD